ncbi:O-antigen polymerase [Loktanella sp. M215]|uniref:O-antigen polymerase n=1 Tax=Loktanella sp. M215 TaxID=2675431 RepID=UPI001F42F27E|nr:O-antigen polymerase [Loktanella sp. M215]MCF7702177.1 oligosaccharide repeat unit polymerase [Loktanella sp. M215]
MTYDYDIGHHLLAYGNLIINTVFLLLFGRFHGFRILEPATWYLFFHYILFAFRPVVLFTVGYHGNYSYMAMHPDVADSALTFLITNVALLAFLLGCVLPGRPTLPAISEKPNTLEVQTFFIAALLFAPLYLYSIYYGISNPLTETNATSSGNIMIDPETGKKIFVTGSGYFYVLKNCFPGLVIAHIVLFRPNIWNMSAVIVFLTSAILEGRGRFIIIYFLLGLIIYYFQRPKVSQTTKVAVLSSFTVLALVLISLGGLYRQVVRSLGDITWSDFDVVDFINRTPMGDSQEFGMFEFLSYIAKYYPDHDYGYSFFTQYLEVFTKPIPRALWPGKPVGSPIQLVDLDYFGNFQGLTQSMVGAGWLSFGLLGVFLLAFVSGFMMQRFFRFAARNWQDPSIRSIYIVALPIGVQWFRDGAPSIVEFYIFGLYPLLFWAILIHIVRAGYLPMTGRPGNPWPRHHAE